MSDEIEIGADGKAKMFYNGDDGLPWHGLGQVVAPDASTPEVLEAAGMVFEVNAMPLYVEVPAAAQLALSSGVDPWDEEEDSTPALPAEPIRILVPDRVAMIRNTDNKILGVLSSRYTIVQPKEVAELGDGFRQKIHELYGTDVTWTTGMLLREGSEMNLTLKLPQGYEITAGDAVEVFLTLVNSWNGTTPLEAFISTIRVVCANTLNMARNANTRRWTFKHSKTATGEMDRMLQIYAESGHAVEAERDLMKELLDIKVPSTFFKSLVNHLFPLPQAKGDKEINQGTLSKVIEEREELNLQYSADDLNNYRDSAMASFQAVAGFASHYEKTAGSGKPKSDESRYSDIMKGSNLLDEALAFIRAMVD